ncbi:MAG: rod shape-determining protein MreC [Betaproteobacteria bacterium]|nr:rod shape-determining protein MreC [Betaproteobacteria bacterium]NBY06073.1 rod shape-determining protein MreC [Betaproteobacteria bacterium]
MPLGTIDRKPPAFFKHGMSALSKLVLFAILSVLLMVADARYGMTQPLRATMSLLLYPLEWLSLRPRWVIDEAGRFFEGRDAAQAQVQAMSLKLQQQALRSGQVEQLSLENQQLRRLLDLRERLSSSALAAEVLYDSADPFTRKVVIDKGALQGVQPSSPVMDDVGVLGQVTRVMPLVSEVTLVIDREQSIPVLNTRTGARGVAYGEAGGAPLLELRYMAANADIEVGDLLTTSGVDAIYPPGVPVAVVLKVERRAESVFARILCQPQGRVYGARHVMVLEPLGRQVPPRPPHERSGTLPIKGGPR